MDTQAVLNAARQEVYALCKGTRRWTMSIPVQPDHDSDCVIVAGLDVAEAMQKEVANLRAALSFAANVIRSGEPWTTECEKIIGGALRGAK